MDDRVAWLRRFIAERKITPAAEPTLHPDGWIMDNPVQWLMDRTEDHLQRHTPASFAHAELRHTPDSVQEWAALHLAYGDKYSRLRMHGPPGSGKTHAAWALIRAIAMTRASRGRGCRWQFVSNVELNDQLRPKPDESHTHALRRYLDCDLLVLDDLGAGKTTDWVTEQVMRLVDHRYNTRLATIYTSNLMPAQLAGILDARIASRLQAADVILLAGDDRRATEGQFFDD